MNSSLAPISGHTNKIESTVDLSTLDSKQVQGVIDALNNEAELLCTHAIQHSKEKEKLYQLMDNDEIKSGEKSIDAQIKASNKAHEVYQGNKKLYEKQKEIFLMLVKQHSDIDLSKFSSLPLLKLAVIYGDAKIVKILAPLVSKVVLADAWPYVYHFADLDLVKAGTMFGGPPVPNDSIIDALLLNEPNFSKCFNDKCGKVFIDMLENLQSRADKYVEKVLLPLLSSLNHSDSLMKAFVLAAKYNIPRLFHELLERGVELTNSLEPPKEDPYGEIASTIKRYNNRVRLDKFIEDLMHSLSALSSKTKHFALFGKKAINIPLRTTLVFKLVIVKDMLAGRVTKDRYNDANRMLLFAISEYYLSLKNAGSERYMKGLADFMSKNPGCLTRFQVPDTVKGLEKCIARLTENGWSCFDEVLDNYQPVTDYVKAYNIKIYDEMIANARKAIKSAENQSLVGDMKLVNFSGAIRSRTAGSSVADIVERKRDNNINVKGKVSQNFPERLTDPGDLVLFKRFLLSAIDEHENPFAEISHIINTITDNKILLLHNMLANSCHDVTKMMLKGEDCGNPALLTTLKIALSDSANVLKSLRDLPSVFMEQMVITQEGLSKLLTNNTNAPSHKAGFR